jgi:hypothetical protein
MSGNLTNHAPVAWDERTIDDGIPRAPSSKEYCSLGLRGYRRAEGLVKRLTESMRFDRLGAEYEV